MRLCQRVSALGAVSPRAVGQLSAFRPCNLGVHDVGHFWVGAADPQPGGSGIVFPLNFLYNDYVSVCACHGGSG